MFPLPDDPHPSLIPKMLLAAQLPAGTLDSGARRLCFAVLQDAILLALELKSCRAVLTGSDQHYYQRHAQKKREEAQAWIVSDATHPFSFLFCCAHLRLNPAWIRRGIDTAVGLPTTLPDRTHKTSGPPRAHQCRQGHPLTDQTRYYDPNGRSRGCRICKQERERARRQRQTVTLTHPFPTVNTPQEFYDVA